MSHSACFAALPPPELRAKAAALAVKENPRNAFRMGSSKIPWDSKDMAIMVGKLWQSGRALDVNFLGDNWVPDMRHKIEKHANRWAAYANVKFHFTLAVQSDIRIEWANDGKDWSKIGTDALLVEDLSQPTMHLGSIGLDSDEDTLKYVIMHQFGHALGCIHEFQSPKITMEWEEDVVYEYFRKKGWTNQETLENIMKRYPSSGTDTTDFDVNSIMMMAIPKEWTRNGFTADQPKELSENDMIKIREMYNGDLMKRPSLADTGKLYSADDSYFCTLGQFDSTGGLQSASHHVDLSDKTYDEPPNVAIGINWLDFGYKHNMRIDASVEQLSTTGFDVQLSTWSTSVFYSAACSWLKFAQNDSVFRCGSAESTSIKSGQPSVVEVKFDRKFKDPPTVIVWINKLDMNSDKNYRIRVGADHITSEGCHLTFETWYDTIVYSCRVTYVAIKAETKGIAGGIYATSSDYRNPQRTYTGTATYDHSVFSPPRSPPRTVLLGFNELDLKSNPCNSRIKTSWSGLDNGQFNWTIETWWDSVVYSAGVSYIVS